MEIDLVLAIAHHLAIITLIVLLGMEFALLRPGLTGDQLRRLALIDAGYGASAGIVIVVGICRVVWGIKGQAFYFHNPWFWAKMASFATIGLLSIPPTLALLKWRKAQRIDAGFTAPDDGIAQLRRFVHAEVALLALVVAFAAAMARYGGF